MPSEPQIFIPCIESRKQLLSDLKILREILESALEKQVALDCGSSILDGFHSLGRIWDYCFTTFVDIPPFPAKIAGGTMQSMQAGFPLTPEQIEQAATVPSDRLMDFLDLCIEKAKFIPRVGVKKKPTKKAKK
jgi:hypothetical protein